MLVYAMGEVAQFTASDGDVTLNCVTEADTETDGQFVFPRVFPDVVKSLPGSTIEISAEGTTGTVASGRSTFTFPVSPGEDYPFPSLSLPVIGDMDGPEFRMALRKVLPAASKDNPLPALTAIRLETGALEDLRLVATDKYHLAVSDCGLELSDCDHGGKVALLPGRVAEKIVRMDGAGMTLALDDGRIQFRSGGFTVTCTQVDAQGYPKWDFILSMGQDWLQLPGGLADAVKRAVLTLKEKEPVSLIFARGELVVATETDRGCFSESLPVDYEGEQLELLVSPGLLLDALAWCDEISLQGNKPLLLRGPGCRYLVQVRRGNA